MTFLFLLCSINYCDSLASSGQQNQVFPNQKTTVVKPEDSKNQPKFEFENRLQIPELYEGDWIDGKRTFRLTVKNSFKEFLRGKLTPTAGINGPYLGPTLKMNRGDKVEISVLNKLQETTTMHWHGMHVPAKMDGTPHQQIESGKQWIAKFPVDQQAATLWYHPHPHKRTGPQVHSGLAGLLIVDDRSSTQQPLPKDYGVDDIPIILQDRKFDQNGQFVVPKKAKHLGDRVLVNGTLNPFLEVAPKKVRFRILNGSNSRVFYVGFEDERTFLQIATDGGLLNRPVSKKRIILGAGERAEILVDFSDRKDAVLRSYSEYRPKRLAAMKKNGVHLGDFKLLRISPLKDIAPPTDSEKILTHATKLNEIERIPKTKSTVVRKMQMGIKKEATGPQDTTSGANRLADTPKLTISPGEKIENANERINFKEMDMHRVDERVLLGSTEMWVLTNDSNRAHPFHIHLVQFQIYEKNGSKPAGADLGWKDTVLVEPGDEIKIIMKFDKYSDPQTPYMYHCHILEHEDQGMMGQFLIVKKPDALKLFRNQPTVAVFIAGLNCKHCLEQIRLFDKNLKKSGVNFVVIAPEFVSKEKAKQITDAPIIGDPKKDLAGWFGLLHLGPAHGTLIVDNHGEVVWSDTNDEPYMNIDRILHRVKKLEKNRPSN